MVYNQGEKVCQKGECDFVEPIKNKDQRIWTNNVERSEEGRNRSTNTNTHRCGSYIHRAKSEDRR